MGQVGYPETSVINYNYSLRNNPEECSSNLLRKFKSQNLTRKSGAFHENQHTFIIISRSVPIRMRNVSEKSCRENQNTFYVQKLIFENRTVYEITWKNTHDRTTEQFNNEIF